MIDKNSEIMDFYPKEFKTDLNGKKKVIEFFMHLFFI